MTNQNATNIVIQAQVTNNLYLQTYTNIGFQAKHDAQDATNAVLQSAIDGIAAATNLLSRYAANTNAGETVDVFATGLGITSTRTNSVFYYNIPAGVHIISSKIRVTGDLTDSGKIYLQMGTNDFNSATIAGTWVPGVNCFRESDYANVGLTAQPTLVNRVVVSGMGTSGGITYQVHLYW
jgi:hypothetical protein